jgi:tetratricopeptide (TPR) repeat protein
MGDCKGLILVMVLLGCLLTPGWAGGVSPYDDALVKQAVADLDRENYDEALEALTQAWEKGTRTPEKAFYLGKVYRLRLEYPQARQYLEEAVRLKPDYPAARLLLADTLVALGQLDAALEHLKKLEGSGYQPGQTALLLGLVATKQGQHDRALNYFRQAQADPQVAQEAKIQMSLALTAQNRLADARKVLSEAISLDPGTPLADLGQRYSAALERRSREARPFSFSVSTGWDFDSNVTLQPGDPVAAQDVAGKGDMVYTQTATLDYNLALGGPWSLLARYAYYQNFHPRLTTFDLLSNTFTLSPSYTFKDSRLWLPFSFNYTNVESDQYFTGFNLNPTYLYLLTPQVALESGLRLAQKKYWFPPSIPQDDRDARNVGASLGVYHFLQKQEGYLLARFIYEHDFAEGSNWDNSSYRLFFAALYPVTSRLKVGASVDLILQPYDNPFFTGNPVHPVRKTGRDDQILIFGVQATYAFYKGLEFNVHYYLVRAASNVPLYDYDRHIVGAQLGYRY